MEIHMKLKLVINKLILPARPRLSETETRML